LFPNSYIEITQQRQIFDILITQAKGSRRCVFARKEHRVMLETKAQKGVALIFTWK